MNGRFKVNLQTYDILFYFLLVFSFYFTRNMLCRLMMLLFFGYTVLRQISAYSKPVIPFFCIGYSLFIIYNCGHFLFGDVLNKDVVQTMIGSLILNLMMIYAIVQYICIRKNILQVLRITERSIITTTVVVVLLSIGTITQGRLGGNTEMNSNSLSMLCVYGFLLAIYLKKKKKISYKFFMIRMGIYVLSIMLTGSRKGLIMLVLSILIINMVGGSRRFIKTVLISAGSVVVILFLITNIPVLYNTIGVRVESLLLLLTEGSTAEGSLISRQYLAQLGMEYFAKKPWFGYGLDCFKLISGVSGQGKVSIGSVGYYSHNNYVELLVGSGIIGFVLYYIPMIYLFQRLLKFRKNDTCVAYLMAIFVAKHAIEYAYVSYYVRQDTYIVAIILGCIMLIQREPMHMLSKQITIAVGDVI